AAYPKMDKDGLDALVLDRMLGLTRDLDIVLPAEDDLTSLKVTRCLQAYLSIKRRSTVAACTGPAEERAAPDEVEFSQAFASLDASRWWRAERRQRDDRDRRTGASSGPGSSPVVCFKCGLPGHISKRCRTKCGRPSRTSSSFGRPLIRFVRRSWFACGAVRSGRGEGI
ncbi:unnamed protein product, partial [Lampetra planeri]